MLLACLSLSFQTAETASKQIYSICRYLMWICILQLSQYFSISQSFHLTNSCKLKGILKSLTEESSLLIFFKYPIVVKEYCSSAFIASSNFEILLKQNYSNQNLIFVFIFTLTSPTQISLSIWWITQYNTTLLFYMYTQYWSAAVAVIQTFNVQLSYPTISYQNKPNILNYLDFSISCLPYLFIMLCFFKFKHERKHNNNNNNINLPITPHNK